MKSKPTIGIGILSWKGYDSLEATLKSYRDANLFKYFDEQLLFLPEIDERGIAIAKKFGIPYKGSETNLGVLGGNKALAEAMKSDYILLLENDYRLIESEHEVKVQLDRALQALSNGHADIWRFRHRSKPGDVWHIWKTERYWPRDDASGGSKFMAALRRIFRPGKAKRKIGNTVFFYDDADRRFPKYISKTAAGDFIVSSAVLNWANNAVFINRRFFLETIIPAALARKTKRLINKFPTIETELNSRWWRKQRFKIGISNPGLFTHMRMGDRGY